MLVDASGAHPDPASAGLAGATDASANGTCPATSGQPGPSGSADGPPAAERPAAPSAAPSGELALSNAKPEPQVRQHRVL